MRHLLAALGTVLASAVIASAQPPEKPRTPTIGFPTVAAALEAMRAKNGVAVSIRSGWTVIEDRATMSIWSFTSPGHSAHPAAVHRMIVQKGNDILVQMSVLCEAAKSDCDRLVAEFEVLNTKMRDDLNRKRTP